MNQHKIKNQHKVKILCVTDYYLPGFKGGGPIRTLANMRALLADSVELAIFTRDRDLGSDTPYPDTRANSWLSAPDGPVWYADPVHFGVKGMRQAMAGQDFDILYLNSFFGYRSSISLYLSHRRSGGRARILLAPRGEFSPGALAIKRFKKQAFLALVRLLGLYRDVEWHASTAREAEDIERQFPHARGRIHLAADPVVVHSEGATPHAQAGKIAGEVRIAFISRISPMKNLDGLLEILAGVERKAELAIYGPVEDAAHWQQCQNLIARLPANISVHYHGALAPDMVSATFAAHDLFAFPTHGENFGHVIFESLRAGTPVLLSDRTPWRDDPSGAITIAPLDSPAIWRKAIERAADRDSEQQQALRMATLEYARRYADSDATRSDNLNMFQTVAGRKTGKD